ncbi:MAG TPA: ribosome biogenesis GTP-binding protein YihA/YsxC [Burkholderiales bacterium]|jgi:GTP-binding protein|nr:ribosome biogenesis GTP-binding protein YihA/YsxC [Burkholderiales bacterium]
MQPFSNAQFLLSVGEIRQLPPPEVPELAFAGRSNVGKSSAINALTGRKRLAHTSKTPGRTQTINFYSLGESARLVDLPGYGYARVPQALRGRWEALVGGYLSSRTALTGVVLVMDARHPLTELDEHLLAWLGPVRALLLLSKCDKLTRREQASTLQNARARAAEREGETSVQLFSSLTRQGVDECRGLLELWLQQAAGIKMPPVKGI